MKKKVPVYVFLALLPTCILLSAASRHVPLSGQQNDLGFPFEIKLDQRTCCVGGAMWSAAIIMPKDYYSRENLDRLFRFYSKQHPNKEERLRVEVYTDTDAWRRKPEPGQLSVRINADPNYDPNARRQWYDAIFWRQGDGAASGGGDNEWYLYCPDLDKPNEFKTIVLKGGSALGPKRVIEEWQISNQRFRIHVISYELTNAEPRGTYYTFRVREEGSDDFRSVMTFQQKPQTPIPRDQVKFLDDKTCFLYMGWMYAVTTDGGHIWSVWDAEKDLPGWWCCDNALINSVQVESDGRGTMSIGPTDGVGNKPQLFRTNDYGHNWRVD